MLSKAGVISFFYIKPQLASVVMIEKDAGVISFFYIKPQLNKMASEIVLLVLYLSSTSNHNPPV